MSIVLQFNNPNPKVTTKIKVYRSDTTIPDVPTFEPIVELNGFATAYEDKDVIPGKSYYYRFSVGKTGLPGVMGREFMASSTSITGPGQFTEMFGIDNNMTSAYYGKVTSPDLPTKEQMLELAGDPTANVINWTGYWHKFEGGGEIVYIAEKAFVDLGDKTKAATALAKFALMEPVKAGSMTYSIENPKAVSVNASIGWTLNGIFLSEYVGERDYPGIGYDTLLANILSGSTDAQVFLGLVKYPNGTLNYRYGRLIYPHLLVPGHTSAEIKETTVVDDVTSAARLIWKPVLRLVPNTRIS